MGPEYGLKNEEHSHIVNISLRISPEVKSPEITLFVFLLWDFYASDCSQNWKGQENMTRIIYERSGGALGNEIHFEQELEALSRDDAENLLRLIQEADFFNLPENLVVHPSPDEFQYQITIEDDDGSHTVRVSDSTMEKPLLPLIKELTLLKLFQ